MSSGALKGEMHKVLPVINSSGSDSAMLDNTLEFLMMSGMPLPKAVMITIPEPWENDKSMSQTKRVSISTMQRDAGAMGWPCFHCLFRW